MNKEKNYLPQALDMAQALLNFGAFDVDVLDVSKKTKMAQNMVICTVNSPENAKEIVGDFCQWASEKKYELFSCDGFNKADWIVLDYDEVIIHLFNKGIRTKFNLEKLWK